MRDEVHRDHERRACERGAQDPQRREVFGCRTSSASAARLGSPRWWRSSATAAIAAAKTMNSSTIVSTARTSNAVNVDGVRRRAVGLGELGDDPPVAPGVLAESGSPRTPTPAARRGRRRRARKRRSARCGSLLVLLVAILVRTAPRRAPAGSSPGSRRRRPRSARARRQAPAARRTAAPASGRSMPARIAWRSGSRASATTCPRPPTMTRNTAWTTVIHRPRRHASEARARRSRARAPARTPAGRRTAATARSTPA